MAQDDLCTADVTLVARLSDDPQDQAAWSDFVARYGPKVRCWCLRWRLQEADAEDVTRDVLVKLNARIAGFTDDATGSLGAWLKTLVQHTWRDFVDERRAGIAAADRRVRNFLNSLDAGLGLVAELHAEFQRELVGRAIQRVRPRVSARAWEAFRLTALDGWSDAAVADHLEIKIARVYLAKSGVAKRLRAEIRRLDVALVSSRSPDLDPQSPPPCPTCHCQP